MVARGRILLHDVPDEVAEVLQARTRPDADSERSSVGSSRPEDLVSATGDEPCSRVTHELEPKKSLVRPDGTRKG